MRPWSVTNSRLPGSIPTLPPSFPRPALRKRKRGMSLVPQELNFSREASHSFGVFFKLMYYIQGINNIYIYVHISFLGLVVDLLGSHHWTQMEKL